jgi:hypothetical protein
MSRGQTRQNVRSGNTRAARDVSLDRRQSSWSRVRTDREVVLENDPVQKAQYRRVWQWNDWPGRWAADAGIDLVAERNDRSLVAVQVKCYRADRFVSKRARTAGPPDPLPREVMEGFGCSKG